MFQQIHAIDARHPNIEKDAARCQSVHLFEKLGAAFKKHRLKPGHLQNETKAITNQIGRESCRERVCQYVKISVVAVSLKKKKIPTNYPTHSSISKFNLKYNNTQKE